MADNNNNTVVQREAPITAGINNTEGSRNPEYWIEHFGDLHKSSLVGFGISIGFIAFGLFNGKALGDADRCSGGTTLSQNVLLYALGAVVMIWICTFYAVPTMSSFARGLLSEDLAERQMRTKLKLSYSFGILVLMVGVIFMCLSTFYFVEVRLGLWGCLSGRARGFIILIDYAMVVIECLLVGVIYGTIMI